MTNTNLFKTYRLAGLASLATVAVLSGFTAGCENSDKTADVSWNGTKPASASVAAPQGSTSTSSSTSSTPAAAAGDAASFSSFPWNYGGFNGSGAAPSAVTLSGLNIAGKGMSFTYVTDLSAWGMGAGDIGAIAALFVKNSAGQWVGGKFDFISSSRKTRSFTNVFDGYKGWSLSGVPNPCEAAFVIVKADGSKRSNVITGKWSR